VTTALRSLAKRELVTHEKYGHVELTEAGRKQAEKIANRHQIIIRFLRDILKMDPETSSKDACLIEHAVSPETVRRLAVFTEFVESCRSGTPDPNNFFYPLGPSRERG
jgi:DtxR family Mn-dependent transcriptional regulator